MFLLSNCDSINDKLLNVVNISCKIGYIPEENKVHIVEPVYKEGKGNNMSIEE
jgi:hypothetical protein